MFYYKTGLVRRIRVHPQYVGGKQDPHQMVRKMLQQDIRENCFSTEYGYIVDQIAVQKIGDGYCLPLTGLIEFVVTFEAILLYPIVGEVVNAVVEAVTDTCIIFRHACVYGVVRSYCLNDQDFFKYEERDVVSEKDKGREGTFKEGFFRSQTNSDKVIERGTAMRVRIIRRTLGENGFFLIGSMSSEFLGPLKNPSYLNPRLEAPVRQTSTAVCLYDENAIPIAERDKMMRQIQLFNAKKDNDDDDDKTSVESLDLE